VVSPGRARFAAREEPEDPEDTEWSERNDEPSDLEATDAEDFRDPDAFPRSDSSPYALRALEHAARAEASGTEALESRRIAVARVERGGSLGGAEQRTRLSALLHDLRADVRPGGAPELDAAPLATGLPEIDGLLGGGFPRGRIAEIAGPLSSGRTSLALALLAETTRRGSLASVIDAADAFDPSSAHAAGIDLARVLWARPPGLAQALRCAEHVLGAGGFALVIVDLAFAAARERPHVPPSAWPRLRKRAASTGAGLVLLTRDRLAGASADLALELAARARFAAQPYWLEALESRVQLVRNRAGPVERVALVRFASCAA
ncbi:MAG TPA: hypothetical protein VFT98_08610, partial [Myxococcota bacterium]|nr:hypothetical protein [Myxococcota bacterium]